MKELTISLFDTEDNRNIAEELTTFFSDTSIKVKSSIEKSEHDSYIILNFEKPEKQRAGRPVKRTLTTEDFHCIEYKQKTMKIPLEEILKDYGICRANYYKQLSAYNKECLQKIDYENKVTQLKADKFDEIFADLKNYTSLV